MTPALESTYDALLAQANASPLSAAAAELRKSFAARCGSYEEDHPGAEAREAAAWEDALVAGGLARSIGNLASEPRVRDLARAVERAHHGVFVFERGKSHVSASDLWSGAEFVLADADDLVRTLPPARIGADSPVCQGRLIATPDGGVFLPGAVFHPFDARAAIVGVLSAARERRLDRAATLDALLRMEHTFRTLSRVKVAFAYRAEALPKMTRASAQ